MSTRGEIALLVAAIAATVGIIAIFEVLESLPVKQKDEKLSSAKENETTSTRVGQANFTPSKEWKVVEDWHILPAGLEIKMDLQTGEKLARLCQ
mmetsp:Transcript_7387/g.8484  ORF Transcript_7387/g.8484 Transcript_7387/m.8484 type:complete len:94 (-) Transcript_7387:843-1124(-)|eukprot:CAMPEP_0184053938 /NCGR_PEP_ID=MMETSP0956-20121227/6276_1 /TAXON_ID=627963 /ORGANISM="Aplanochytrium sp, Strain PBS07" /LENGTH=93 /DNA_ID=CAMNT_0026347461 /DNA_START=101 /DNA_END=382 /DNA_ORIENTATION=+